VIRTLTTTLRSTIASTLRLPKLESIGAGGVERRHSKLATEQASWFGSKAALRAEDFPIRIAEVRISDDPLNSDRARRPDGGSLLTYRAGETRPRTHRR